VMAGQQGNIGRIGPAVVYRYHCRPRYSPKTVRRTPQISPREQ
jgi:hypothetical protein